MIEFEKIPSVPEERERRIVVVADSDPAHLYYTSIVLQRLDYVIQTSKTGADVLSILDMCRPALLLTEAALSDMNQIELLRVLKRNPRTFSLPVIVLTASKDPAVREACMAEGCKAFLQKPVEPEALYAAIQKATESTPRQYIRLSTTLNVMVGDDKAAELSVIENYITALSEQGMFVNTAKPKPVGVTLPITIFLETHRIKVDAIVLYSFERGKGPLRTAGMGVKFVHIGEDDRALIRAFIRREITKGLTPAQIGGTIM